MQSETGADDPMIRGLGRHASLWSLTLIGLVALAPLAVFLPLQGAFAFAGFAGLGCLVAHVRANRLAARCDKLSQEVDGLSKRLLQAETAVAAPPRPDPVQAERNAEVEELSLEIGLLSGIVRDLTNVVTAQDREIAAIKQEVARPIPAPVPPAQPAPAPRPAAPAVVAVPAPQPAAPQVVSPQVVSPSARTPRPEAASPPAEAPRRPESVPEPVPPPVAARSIPPRPIPPRTEPVIADEAVIAAFEAEGLEVHLQPVVTLPQRKVTSYEALARLRVGEAVLAPEAFLPVLERYGRTTALDREMLQRVATISRHLAGRGSEAAVAYGLSPLSLFEPGFLRWLARLVAGEPSLAGRLVVALPQASWRSLDAEQTGALAAMRGKIGLILDRPTDLRFDVAALAASGVGQVKVPASLMLRPGASRRTLSDIVIEDIVAALSRAGIRLVATDVEAEADVPDLIDLDVPFAQGLVFAPPRPVRSDVLAAPAPAPVEPEAPAEPAQERRPFRSFLRRAS